MSLSNSTDRPADAFLAGGGETGALLRAFNWADHPLGLPAQWPAALRTSVRILLTTQHPVFIFWGAEHYCFYNDAYAASLGPEKHPSTLGARGAQTWSEIWHLVGAEVEYVMRGEGATWHENQIIPIIRFGRVDDVYWTYSFSPIDDTSAPHGVGGVLIICNETTAQVLEDQRQAFLVALDDQVRRMTQREEIIAYTLTSLSEHLRASRFCFGLVDEDGTHVHLKTYVAKDVPEFNGRFSLQGVDASYLLSQQQGTTLICHDVATERVETQKRWTMLQMRSFLSVPLIRDGRLRATLFINDRDPRLWSASDVRLVEQVAALLWDALERRYAESELVILTKRFELALTGSPIVIFSQDLELRYTWIFNPPVDVDASSFIGKRDIETFERSQDGEMTEALKREVIRTGKKMRREIMVPRGGINRHYTLLIDPIVDQHGKVTGITCVGIDISDAKHAEENQTLLIDELNHRVKNTLALVQSITRQTFKGKDVPDTVRHLLEGRIIALAGAHDILTRAKWTSPLLATVVEESLQFCGPAAKRVSHTGPDVMLAPDQAIPIAMALHELCTNALKYGALANEAGSIHLNWQIQANKQASDQQQLLIHWREQDGPPVIKPRHAGFGSMMIEKALSQQLDGHVSLMFEPAGVRCEINIPLRTTNT